MKRLLLSVAAAARFATSAVADYTFVVPQRAGQGTTVWAEIIAKESGAKTQGEIRRNFNQLITKISQS